MSSLQPEVKVHLEFRSGLLDFPSFTEKPIFECAFAHPIKLFLSDLKQYGYRVSVICILAMKSYLMRSVSFKEQ